MNRDQLLALLAAVKEGTLPIARAADELGQLPVDDLGFARLDQHRELRCGFPEVIFGQGKSRDQLLAITAHQLGRHADPHLARLLLTRIDQPDATALLEQFPHGEYDPIGRTLWYGRYPENPKGRVVVATAGTGDLAVAREAYTTARAMGTQVELITDVGVAGLHRLLAVQDRLRAADVVVAIAGMEGAMVSVIGGLIDRPVIAVPSSCGYGANFHGVTTLLSMLSSCAANVSVVNIDSGFCGGYVAALIATPRSAQVDNR